MRNALKGLGLLLLVGLSACYRPPYNDFKPQPAVIGLIKDTRRSLLKDLYRHDIEVVQYGDQVTLIVPIDRYFAFNSPRLHEREYKGLEDILNFIKLYPKCMITVAGFSDNVEKWNTNLRLTDQRAHTMVGFLWANGISAKRLMAQGFGSRYAVGDNQLVHGRAYNRRLEIQWPVTAVTEWNVHP